MLEKTAWQYDPRGATDALLALTARQAQVRDSGRAHVISLAVASTEGGVAVADVPRPGGPSVRPPAVAGAFYPVVAADLARVFDGLLPRVGSEREPRAAVMVPHAALRCSGRIAAAVYARVAIPEVVVVLAPRHHPRGADWAVAPHKTWSLPGLSVPSDSGLAHELVETIADLELDAAAHEREHAIEVQLPLLARVAPGVRVVDITLGAVDVDRCRRFAIGLAEVLRARRDRPPARHLDRSEPLRQRQGESSARRDRAGRGGTTRLH